MLSLTRCLVRARRVVLMACRLTARLLCLANLLLLILLIKSLIKSVRAKIVAAISQIGRSANFEWRHCTGLQRVVTMVTAGGHVISAQLN